MRFSTTIIATNGYPGVSIGDDAASASGKPYVWVERTSGHHWKIYFFDGVNFRLIKAGGMKRSEAIDLACDHAETLRVPAILMETRPSAPAASPRRA